MHHRFPAFWANLARDLCKGRKLLLKLRVGNLMVYVEHRKQLQKDFDLLRENAQLRSEVQRLRGDLQRLQAPAGP